MANTLTLTDKFTLASGKLANAMDTVRIPGVTVESTKANGKMTTKKGSESSGTRTSVTMKATGLKVKDMVRALKPGRMVTPTMDSIDSTISMAMVTLSGRKLISLTKVSTLMATGTAEVSIDTITVATTKDSSKMI